MVNDDEIAHEEQPENQPCLECEGTGDCVACDGTGLQDGAVDAGPCEVCKGSGSCVECDGSGVVPW